MAVDERPKGSVYQQWHETVLRPYAEILRMLIKKIEALPRYPFTITETDIKEMKLLAAAFDVPLDGLDLYDEDNYYYVLGRITRMALEKVEKDLKPEDPYVKLLLQMDEDKVRKLLEEEQ